jgi:hypothetical protein
MGSNKSTYWNKAMYWGFFIALASMLLTTVYYSTDNMFASSKSWIDTAIYVVGIVLCTIAFKKTLPEDAEFTYSNALGLGVSASFFASLILALFTFVLYKYIDPDLIEQTLVQTEEKLIEAGFNDEMIETQVEFQRKFVTPALLSITTIFSVTISGLIISLITSIFLKKKTTSAFDAAMNELK